MNTSTLINLSTEDLEQVVFAAVQRALAEQSQPPEWLNTRDAAAYVSLTENALRLAIKRGEIAPHRAGSRLRFLRRELDAWAGGRP